MKFKLKYPKGIKERPCTLCSKVKSINDFSPRSNRPSGHQSRCKECVGALRNNWPRDHKKWYQTARQKEPEFYREKNLMRSYGITINEYEKILVEQNSVCVICDGPAMGKGRYHVDHDHKTGKIRGLLCHKCNIALGMVQDSVEHLQKLIDYLIRTGTA